MTDGKSYFLKGLNYDLGLNGITIDKNFAIVMYQKAAELGFQPEFSELSKFLTMSSIISVTTTYENILNQSGSTKLMQEMISASRKTASYSSPAKNNSLITSNNTNSSNSKITQKAIANTILNSAETARVADIGARFANGLEDLNTARGGGKGIKGFVGEQMQAAQASFDGKMTYVINNNGSADLVYVGKNGRKYYQQMKIGPSHNARNIDFKQYKGQTLVVDKGNPNFKQIKAAGAKHGVKVIEGNLTNEEVETLTKLMQKETAIRGTKKATIVPKAYASHKAGLQSAKTGAVCGGGFSLGTNLVDVVTGDKSVGEAVKDVAKDTAIGYATGYVTGTVGSAVASTSTGAAAISAVSTAASTVGTAVTSTTIGSAVVGAGTTAAATVAGAGTAISTAVASGVATTAAAGTAIGTAAVTATTAVAGSAAGAAVASGVAATAAAGAAVGAAAVAAAPFVAAGAVVGGIIKLFSFWDD